MARAGRKTADRTPSTARFCNNAMAVLRQSYFCQWLTRHCVAGGLMIQSRFGLQAAAGGAQTHTG
jgi:hypothetical protein